MTTCLSFVLLIVLICARGADAQESRADTLKQAREAKQQAVAPYEPTMLERVLRGIERGGVPLITRDGVYLKLGSITTGSGFAYGAVAAPQSHRLRDSSDHHRGAGRGTAGTDCRDWWRPRTHRFGSQ